ncbi:MAG: hypothetical protein Q7N95_08575, partial [Alphaproteobacteria bacterium]|nr:hypothetical protein [Alphaproteobacteria bacterium]
AAGTSQAAVLYGNFDPTATAPVDYSTSAYADLSGSCSTSNCLWINAYSAGFSFVAESTGLAAKAFLPMKATYTVAGAERIYGLTITDQAGGIVARGGILGRDAPIGVTQVHEFDLFASTHAGQPVASGVLSATAPELQAGSSYNVFFSQTYGSMSGAQWMKSDAVPTSGQAFTQCQTNGGSYCAYWGGSWIYPLGYSYTAPMTDFLPALVITDGAGLSARAPQTVPLPPSWALAALGLARGGWQRRTTFFTRG